MNKFKLQAPFKAAGDQPKAIKELTAGIEEGRRFQTLLGVTGSGKTYTMAAVIEKLQKPAIIISHNKTLAAQLATEFKEFFPKAAVEYFVSYYDYYQPEAYLPHTDTYIAKDAAINDQIDRLRHAAMEAVLTRQDVVVVASVSCIYGIGSPANYLSSRLALTPKQAVTRRDILSALTRLQYKRNDVDLIRGTYRSRGDVIDIYPAGEEEVVRIELLGNKIDRLLKLDPLTGEVVGEPLGADIFPATFFMTTTNELKGAITAIRHELTERIKFFQEQGKVLEAERIKQRAEYDLEMLEHLGYVSGIENYSRHMDGRTPGEPPYTLIDYFGHVFGKDGFLTFIDESHMTIPQLFGMHAGDFARKKMLIDHGFRLPSAYDNRPLKYQEFDRRINQTVFVSATPADFEHQKSAATVEQIVRPTGLVDPEIAIRSTQHQVDDLLEEIQRRIKKKQRVLVTTLTKRLAEELSSYLIENGLKAAYLHADIDTIERWTILNSLRQGKYDILVGINLLREGLDLPEVSLVAILDADKEGYLRSDTALIQTMGRAARHIDGHVIMYADKVTGSMQRAIDETNRRRTAQLAYNQKHHITPQSITKAIRSHHLQPAVAPETELDIEQLSAAKAKQAIKEITDKMELAARNLEFERAAELRDLIQSLRTKQRAKK